MKRYDALKEILKNVHDELIICNIGFPSKELYSLKERDQNFYMMGSMGLASSIALGLALAQPDKKVWCIDGDGSILMNLGSLSTIGQYTPPNLILIIIDNGCYGSTGNQKTHTCNKTQLEIIAKGAGFESIHLIEGKEEILPKLETLGSGCHFILIKTEPGNAKVENIPLHPISIKERFINSIGKQ